MKLGKISQLHLFNLNTLYKYLVFILLLPKTDSLAQNNAMNWYFGAQAAINFSTNPPNILTNSAMGLSPNQQGCSTISDANGNLLFYTDGFTVWNKQHVVMANGTGLGGWAAPANQPAIILKQPGSNSIYYIFHTTGYYIAQPIMGRVYYSIVDMNLAAGNGSVTTKNFSLYIGNSAPIITATKHCNGVDSWIITQDYYYGGVIGMPNMATVTMGNRCFLLTSTGVNTTAVVSNTVNLTINSAGPNWFNGLLRCSPLGNKIANSLSLFYGSPTGNNPVALHNFRVCDFDNTTGIVSNPILLLNNGDASAYGLEFSPDGSKLYGGVKANLVTTTLSGVYQWNLCAGSTSAIQNSQYFIPLNDYNIGSFQLAPNGKIYIAHNGQSSLSVINNPNTVGAGCNFSILAQPIGNTVSGWGLPNFVGSSFFTKPTPSPFSYSQTPNTLCNTLTFSSSPSPTAFGCAFSGYSLTGVSWNFGDPLSGAANTSTLMNPIHSYPTSGSYSVQLIMHYSCGGGTDTLNQIVNVNGTSLSITSTSITCATLGSGQVTANGGLGAYSFTWMPSNQTSSIAIGLNPGLYTVTAHDNLLNCFLTQTVNFPPLIPLSATLSSSPSNFCNGASTGTASFGAISGGSANQNFFWSNGLQTFTTAFVNNLSAGTWSSTITDALTGCQVFSVFSISQPPALTLNLSSGSPSICAGGSVVLSSTLSGGTPGYAYNWTGGVNTDSFVFSNTNAGSYVYTLNALDAYSCAVSNTLGVDVIANPVLLVPNVSICPLETATLVASGATSYTWNNTVTGATFTDSPTAFSQYTVLGSALGCTNTAVASVNIKPTPNPVLSSNSPVCEQSTFSLSASAGTAYVWSGPGGFSSFASVLSIPSVSLTQAGLYQVTVTAANACTATASQSVVVKPLPTLSLSASAASICLGVNATSLFTSGTATLFSWSPTVGLSSGSGVSVSASPSLSTNYSVLGFLNGCSRTQSVSVTVVSPPNLSIALSSNSFCAQAFNGSPNTITLTSSGASSYTLSTPNHFANPNPSGPASPINLMPPYLISGPSTATLYGSNGVCTVSTTAQFSVVPNPTASVSNPTPVICAGQSYTYTSSGASSYVWSSSTPGNSLYTSGNVAVVNPSIQSVFSVYGSSLGCQSALQNYTLSVNPLPTVAVVPNPTYVCIGSSTELSAKSNGTSFVWYPQNISGASLLVAPSVQQQYTVVASLNNCTQSAVALVSVMPLPIARISNLTPQLCVNEKVQMLASGGQGYVWKGPAGLIQQGAELSFLAFSKAFEGIYTVTVTDELGCKGVSQDTLRLLDLPTGNLFAGKEKGCAPFTTGFVFDTGTKPNERVAGVDWYVNQRHVSADTSYSQVFVVAGNYSVQAKVKGVNGCVNTSSLLVTAYPKPKADFSNSPLLPVENLDEVLFSNNSEGAQQFSWYIRLDYDKKLEFSGERVNYLFENPGLYPVVLLAKSEMGCSDTLIKTIKVEPDFAVYIPNAFTPNGDGKNEGFMPVMRGVRKFTLQIFNRWGKMLFESSSSTNTWDGTYQSQDCKQDVYNYKLQVLSSSGEEKVFVGSVVLYR